MEGEVQGSNGTMFSLHSLRDTIQRASKAANEFFSSRESRQANCSPRPQNLVHNTTWSPPLNP
ncbi:hypothetical protein GBA52_017833 [Prunus armeniaca]|nr:hypothetical protein GBA52_017833 [Prunus armeniaca]